MFGKKKSTLPQRSRQSRASPTQPSQPATPKAPASPTPIARGQIPILVQQSEFDAGGADLVYAIVRYTNLMMEDGFYDPVQLPAFVMQSYHSDLYLAQVNNGGHSQFIGNGDQHFNDTVRNIDLGLKAMGSAAHQQIFMEFLDWMRCNPELTSQQTGFGDIPDTLDQLDSRFYKLSKYSDLSDVNANWIKTWPGLRAVPDAEYKAEMQKLFEANPQKGAMQITRAFRTINYMMTESQTTRLNHAGAQKGLNIIVRSMLSGRYMKIEGRETAGFPVETNVGPLIGVFAEHWVGLYRGVSGAEPKSISIVMNKDWQSLNHKALIHNAPAALHLLLHKLQRVSELGALTPMALKIDGYGCVLHMHRGPYMAFVATPQSAWLQDEDGQKLLIVQARDVLAHLSKVH